MKSISLTLGLICIGLMGIAQVKDNKKDALIIVKLANSEQEKIAHNVFINSLQVRNVELMSQSEAEIRFGKIREGMVFVMTVKPAVKLVTLVELLNSRMIDKNIPIIIDGKLIKYRDDTLIEESEIKSFQATPDSISIQTNSRYNYLQTHKAIDN